MAVIASSRTVDVAAYACMVRICLCLRVERIRMAIDTRKGGIVR